MSIQERKEREKSERRELILKTANEIVSTEGIDSLSIRKIADRIEYSPTIIYHYFKDKDEIINHLMNAGYQKITAALSMAKGLSDQPELRLKELTRCYIDTALKMPEEFKSVQLSSSPAVLEHTSMLYKGASLKNPALGVLFQCLKDLLKGRELPDDSIELTAQVFVSAVLGLIIKLIVEKDMEESQRTKLIEHFINYSMEGMVLGKSQSQDKRRKVL